MGGVDLKNLFEKHFYVDVREFAREAALDEYREHRVYSALARIERNPARREVLMRLAEQERRHYEFWSRIAGGVEPRPATHIVIAYVLMRLLFGASLVAKLQEKSEKRTKAMYREALRHLTGRDREELERIIAEEESHEEAMVSQVSDVYSRYMGSLALGLADAIIEITGAHAGALGTTDSTLVAGVIGLVVGISAAISMASAAYLQAKHETGKSPGTAALVTGLSYIFAVALLSLPYFATHDIAIAFAASIGVAVALTAMLSFQASILADADFKREFAQTTALTLGVAGLAYTLGNVLAGFLGIQQPIVD